MRKLILSIYVCTILAPCMVSAKDLGVAGKIYPVAEKDALKEIEAKAKQVDWNKYINKKKLEKIKNYKPQDIASLPRAKANKTFNVDMTYTLPNDIPDGKGGILYPKGYTFNPAAYLFLPNILVFINGDDPKQMAWFKASPYAKDIKTMVLLTGGNYSKLSDELKRPVYYATQQIADRFSLNAVPCVVMQKAKLMQVTEYNVEGKHGHK